MRAEGRVQGELTTCHAAMAKGLLNMQPNPRHDVPKPMQFKGERSAKDVDNFLWGVEQYFISMGIVDDAKKISTGSAYLIEDALLWWRHRCLDQEDGAITTWEEFWDEFRKQFYPEYVVEEAWSKLRHLEQKGELREYVREFQQIRLTIPKLDAKEGFRHFVDGLKPWVKLELQRRGIRDLKEAMTVAESLVEYKRADKSEPKSKNKGTGGGEKDKSKKLPQQQNRRDSDKGSPV